MQYLGGKSRISKQISEVINEIPRWEIKNSETVGKYDNEHQFSERERVIASYVYFVEVVQLKVK